MGARSRHQTVIDYLMSIGAARIGEVAPAIVSFVVRMRGHRDVRLAGRAGGGLVGERSAWGTQPVSSRCWCLLLGSGSVVDSTR